MIAFICVIGIIMWVYHIQNFKIFASRIKALMNQQYTWELHCPPGLKREWRQLNTMWNTHHKLDTANMEMESSQRVMAKEADGELMEVIQPEIL